MLPLVEGSESAERSVKAGHEIAEADGRTRRITSDGTGCRHQARHRLNEQVVGGQVAQRPALPESGDADKDKARVQLLDADDGEAKALERPRPEVLDQDVRAFDQPLEHGQLGGSLEVE